MPNRLRNVEQFQLVELLLLVSDISPLTGLSKPVPFDRLSQDDGGRALVLDGGLVRGVDLDGVVPAPPQFLDLLVGPVLDQVQQTRVLAEEVLADVIAGGSRVLLVLAVRDLLHPFGEQTLFVRGEQRVPVRAPDHLDDVPPGAGEDRFELLDDLGVAADRAVEPLQVAVDDEDQVVEVLPHGHGDGAETLGLVHLAVAEESPDLLIGRLLEPPVLQVSIESGLVDRHDRRQAHGDGRKFPKAGHEPGMGIGRQAAFGLELPAVVLQVEARQPAFEKGPGIDPRGGVALEIEDVPRLLRAAAAKEMIEAHFEQRGH